MRWWAGEEGGGEGKTTGDEGGEKELEKMKRSSGQQRSMLATGVQ